MIITIPKIFIFLFINTFALSLVFSLIHFIIIPKFWIHPFLMTCEQIFILVIFSLFEISYFRSVFSDPGRLTKQYSDGITNEEECSTIRQDTKQFHIKINSAKRFLSLGGETIKKEHTDIELVQKYAKMPKAKIIQEMENTYLDFLNKKLECHKCNLVKPPRTHHCENCGCCILKMDHHCPWIANCVGEFNLKFFVQFAFYACSGLINIHAMILYFYLFDSQAVFLLEHRTFCG